MHALCDHSECHVSTNDNIALSVCIVLSICIALSECIALYICIALSTVYVLQNRRFRTAIFQGSDVKGPSEHLDEEFIVCRKKKRT